VSDKPMMQMRLAIRQEGQFVNAYVAQATDMAGAFLVGSISLGLLNMRPELFEQFKALMTDALAALIEVGAGGKVLATFEEQAPEHERAGHA
jgi:hypothetical protein